MVRLRKQVHRLHFLQFIAQFLIEFDITRHGCDIAGDISDFWGLHADAGFDEALCQAFSWWID